MHTRGMETDDPIFHRAVSSQGADSERISIELQRLATQAGETSSAAVGAKGVNANGGRSSAVEPSPGPARKVSRLQSVVEIATLAGISFLNTMGSGILIAALPRIAQDLGLPQGLILWPAAVYALAAGCLLLIFGATADIIGTKLVWVTGGFLYTAFTLAIGFAQTGIQLILFRAFQGVAISMCLPTAVSLITNTFPKGKWRNTAFAMNGMGQPLGYALGLVLGGIFTDTVGWRWAYYMMAVISFCLSTAAIWSLPSLRRTSDKKVARQLLEDIDWLGAVIMSVGLGLLFYVLATTSSSYTSIRSGPSIAILVVSLLLLGSFPFWMHHQTTRGKPALIPNRLWSQASFTTVCIAVFFCWASLNGVEYFTTLYFQQVEGVSALQSSIRFLPHVVMGIAVNIVTAYLVSRVRIQYLAVISALITMIAPPLMATVDVGENYWLAPFWALFLSPVNPDVLFTVSNLVISDAFPPEVQSLAGGVFNEVSQFGNSVGLAVTAAIAASITDRSTFEREEDALMKGYRAAFWTIFAGTVVVVTVSAFGLRHGGFIGKKND
ncbi:major facilitator superfamily domain-containing protein [Boeremia exigua]|uniref:major facilitator superfamily domain-containing protein n=1 Tax=Boeremia exigua TaxID=749465 RepID=UPI001E8D0CAA|nr:major facilitator superfamily domain-containing protein [Boeremia exigua]KAH6616645.1 major facilitator superfamily domain-containing protein [Boeremia exigua]